MHFDCRFAKDCEGKCCSLFFFFSHCLFFLTLSCTLPHFCFFLFFLLFPFFFFFFLFFFLFSFLSPLTHQFFFFNFLQVRGSFLSLYYSFVMCNMDTCSKWHSPHHMALMPCVLLTLCHVAPPHVSHDTRCLEKREILTILEFNEIRLGN